MSFYHKLNSRTDILQSGTGVFAETFDRRNANAVIGLVTQRMLLGIVPLRAGDVVTNVLSLVTTAGSSLTLVKFGLYSSAAALLASTADVKADFAGTGEKTAALSSPYTVTANGVYYLAVLGVGTTPPTLAGFTLNSGTQEAVGDGVRLSGQQVSQSDLPSTATIAATGTLAWLGVS